MTRVAWTLKYAGVNNVAILNGGQNQWVIEKRALSQDMVIPKSKALQSGMEQESFCGQIYCWLPNWAKPQLLDTPRAWLL